MIVAEIIARLIAQVPALLLVEGASEIAALGTSGPNATPAAYVFIAEEASAENERVNGVMQRTELDVKVVLVTGNVSDATGAAALADIEPLKVSVRQALIGWRPLSADDVITSVGGQLVRARDNYVWWEMTLATAIYLEA